MLATTLRKPKKNKTKLQNVVIKPPPRKAIVEWIQVHGSISHAKPSESHSNLTLTTRWG